MAGAPSPPDLRPGVVVRLRRRFWRIDGVSATEFAATPIDGRDAHSRRFLRELEEDLLETGGLPLPDVSRPCDPAEQDLLLRATRLGLIHGSAPFLGLQRSRAVPEPYQLVPLLMAMGMPRARLLLGDDVGVGKTVEAGLILAELVARGRARRILVVVPANLREQWRDALAGFFHVEAEIIAGHLRPALERRLLPGQSPWEAFPCVVVSIDYAKLHAAEILSHRWDAAVVDEAHVAARPHQAAGRSQPDMKRWLFLDRLAGHADHLLLLTATPHSGYSDSFASLIETLDRSATPGGRVDRALAVRRVVQRRRQDIERWYGAEGRRPFPTRDQAEQVIALNGSEKALLQRLREYAGRLEERGPSVLNFWVAAHFQRRALSSPAALRRSLDNRRRAVIKRVAGEPAGEAGLAAEAEIAVTDLDAGDDLSDEQRSRRVDIAGLTGLDELQEIEEIERLAGQVTPRRDSKLRYLVQTLLPARLRAHPRQPRVLVFTRYQDTLEYLLRNLCREAQRAGPLGEVRLFTIVGDMPPAERRQTFRRFELAERAVCLATDCISEGLDLQRACAEIVHYELPWNPNRLEQRNGRVDRYGQPEPSVGIRTLVLEDPLDVAILEVLVRKAGEIRREFGVCPAYFSSGSELRELVAAYGRSRGQLELPGLGDPQPLPDGDPFDGERVRRIVAESFYGHSGVRLPEVERALAETHRAVGSPGEVEVFVRSALDRVGGRARDHGEGTLTITLPGEGERTCTFDPGLGRDDPSLEVLDLAHPAVRRLIEAVREEAAGSQRGRFAARATPQATRVTAVAHVLARFTTASEPPLVMEELVPVALPVYGDEEPRHGPELLSAPPAPLARRPEEVAEAGRRALARPDLEARLEAAVGERHRLLVERQRAVVALGEDWARGMDEVSLASRDLLTLTVVFPSLG